MHVMREEVGSSETALPYCVCRINTSRKDALQKLWSYICSIVADSILKWNIVITRFGKPSNLEIRGEQVVFHTPILIHSFVHSHIHTDWPCIVDDGLLDANQLLRGECETCDMFLKRDPRSALIPKLLNVMVVSVQPERNIHLYPTTGQLYNYIGCILR